MSFRGQPYAFDAPSAAIEGMIAQLGAPPPDGISEQCELTTALGRVLAERVEADRDSPPFDTSAMDGYAVRVADIRGADGVVPVVGESRIGREPPVLASAGQVAAVRIVTGAAIPPGADAVIRREDVEERAIGALAGGVASIVLSDRARKVAPGTSIRRQGENAVAGSALLEPGTLLTAASIGTLAAVGRVMPRVFHRLRAAIIVTGDELVDAGSTPDRFQIRDSNGVTVAATLAPQRWLEVAAIERAGDDGAHLRTLLNDFAERYEVVILSGGVSMGHRDPVRGALDALGARVIFHGLPQRPGKPMLGAVLPSTAAPPRIIFALPGNPISAMVTARRIVTPVLAWRAGLRLTTRVPRVRVANPDDATLDLWWHRLVRLDATGDAVLVEGRGSGDIVAGGRSDGFIEVPPGVRADGAFPFFGWA